MRADRRAAWLGLLAAALAAPAAADYQAGLEAWERGEFEAALQEWMAVVDAPGQATYPTVYAETLYAIAMLYWQGQGVPRDLQQSYQWLRRAAEMDHAGAAAKLAYLYMDGTVVERDVDAAFGWYRKAARLGDVDGQYNLGICYLNGLGTEPDATMAAQYLAAAAAQGDAGAEAALEQVLQRIQQGEREAAASPPPAAETAATGPAGVELLNAGWILAQNPGHYTIQVIALSQRDRLERLVAGYADQAPFAVYTVERGGARLYVLVQGDYADVDAARQARDHFPRGIQRTDRLWIRQFGMVQEQLGE